METKKLRDKANDLETNIKKLVNNFTRENIDEFTDIDVKIEIALIGVPGKRLKIRVVNVKVTLTV